MVIKELIERKINYNAYMSEEFLNLFDTYIPYIKQKNLYRVVELKNLDSYRNEGDLISLLADLGTPYEFWMVVARFNNILNNGDLVDGTLSLLIPDLTEISRIYNTYRVIKHK